KNQDFVEKTRAEMNQLLKDGQRIADETLELVIGKLKK
ncbi:MAG TPA: sugar ABC transporter substrate-binding protein, partial [Proteobacteria bacterium]|nr:sugar ABC transporter substrate-binding protein [Pseudomonadota bacterium]